MSEVIFVATHMEAESAISEYGYERICAVPFEVWKNRSKFLVISGIGLVNASMCFAWALENLKFDSAINIGAAGATGLIACSKNSDAKISNSSTIHTSAIVGLEFGEFYEISKIVCLEPYNEDSFIVSNYGMNLVSSSRPMGSAQERAFAAKSAELVDMEAYAFATAAKLFSKKLRVVKLVSDFSPECDIHENILSLRARMAHLPQIWA